MLPWENWDKEKPDMSPMRQALSDPEFGSELQATQKKLDAQVKATADRTRIEKEMQEAVKQQRRKKKKKVAWRR